ncbi:hypothetical protein WMY93_006064 [Mugilogobius chulae]|uniref:Peptidase aspartic putative domain-containing protein n=1 Tax=Mugilogobius chulae TaxID=88201 RepID=A0AAW0PLW4_9GOBI
MLPDRGYLVAKTLLQEHFGNPYKTATAYINKALSWQTIRTDDTKALQSYALFLRSCHNIMEELEYVQELDMPVNMRAILAKLPYKLRERWRSKAHDIIESTGYRAGFSDMVEFIERHVKILSDPFFGDLQEYNTNPTTSRAPKSQPFNRARGNVVASTVTSEGALDGERAGKEHIMLSILPVKVKAAKGNCVIETYAFLDPGSTGTFCSEQLMHRLSLTGKRTQILLRTMGQTKQCPAFSLCNLEVAGLESSQFYRLPEVITQQQMPVTTEDMAKAEDLERWPYLAKVHMPAIHAEVDLLIGTNAPKLLEPWEVINSQENGPYAVKTVLGWVVNGPLDGNTDSEAASVTVNRISVSKLEELLMNQYNHDFCEKHADKQEMSREDLKFLSIMDASAKLKDGKYCVNLPFKNESISLPNNLAVAKQRIQSLKKRFVHNQQFHQEYVKYMKNIVASNYAERVPEDQVNKSDGRVWYIPHHGVYHPRKGALRVVFDCGATFKGVSLNDELLQGPNLTSTLLGVLMRFRQQPIGFMGDIQAMYHQVRVPEEDRDFLRFLWWPNGDTSQEPVPYRMTVHLFGAISSPSCAAYALKRTAQENESEFPAMVIETLQQNFYVDDCLKSAATETEAIHLIHDLIALCGKGGFVLEKWISNSRVVLQAISKEQRAKELKMLDLDIDKLPVERALGLQWCVETDAFKFKMEVKHQALTRRGMLSVNSSVYDPLGFLAPVTLHAKIMQQELCKRGCSWDDSLPQDIWQRWKKWLEELELLATFSVDRCIKPADFTVLKQAQLHHFSDASEEGYGIVSYIRMVDQKGHIHVAFLLGKARVTPLKAVTIPRLELSAAVLAAKMNTMIKAELGVPLQESVFWTDSTSVLKYVNNEDRRFHTFVANRIATIRDLSDPKQWRHVSTKENPADYVSRGMKVSDFLSSRRWLEGPEFLWKEEEKWPKVKLDVSLDAGDKEVKRRLLLMLPQLISQILRTN